MKQQKVLNSQTKESEGDPFLSGLAEVPPDPMSIWHWLQVHRAVDVIYQRSLNSFIFE